MNRVNILTAIDLLDYAKKVNLVMIDDIKNNGPLKAKLNDEDLKTLQSECIAADEAIEVLKNAIREEIDYETYCKQNTDASNSQVIVPADLFDNNVVDY